MTEDGLLDKVIVAVNEEAVVPEVIQVAAVEVAGAAAAVMIIDDIDTVGGEINDENKIIVIVVRSKRSTSEA